MQHTTLARFEEHPPPGTDDSGNNNIVLHVGVTDAGPDIKGARDGAAASIIFSLWEWWLYIDCLAHQYQIMVHGFSCSMATVMALLGLDYKYYTTLASILHRCRENGADIYTAIVRDFGSVAAGQSSLKIVPRKRYMAGGARKGSVSGGC